MEADIIMMIAVATAVVLIVNQIGRIIRSFSLHRTIREGLSRDSNLTPELLDKIEEQRSTGNSDDRTGLVLMALGVAVFLFGVIEGDPDDIRRMAGIAVFPLLVGGVLFGRFWFNRRSGAGA